METNGARDDDTRVACAAVIDPAWCALARREPAAKEQCLAIASDDGARAFVLAMSESAARAGVRRGQRVHRAKAIAPSLLVRVEDPHARASARAALYDAAMSLAPAIEPDEDRVFLDARGVRARHESERGFAAALARVCAKMGLLVDVAIASGKRTARALTTNGPLVSRAHDDEGLVSVAEDDEDARAKLGPRSIAALGLAPSLVEQLEWMGLRRVADLAKLDPAELSQRLGDEAAQAVRLARGEDRSPILRKKPEDRFEERASFEWEIAESEPLLFLCKRLMDSGLARLVCRSLSSREARVSFALRGGGSHERTITVGAPTRESAVWLRLLRASLEAAPPPDAVVGARVVWTPCAPRAMQLGLFDPPGPAPERWSLALARIEATVGEGRVGAACAPNTHRPGELSLAPFDPSAALSPASVELARIALVLHVFRPPKSAKVRYEHGSITALVTDGHAGRVVRCAGPYRRAGHWWSEPFAQDSWDVALEDQTLLRVAYDGRTGAWTVEGRYE